MALKEYDIAGAFQAVEYELINSFLRNMKRHRVEEVKEQKQWEMWQVKQLQELDLYKKRNAKKYGARFIDINKTVAEMIRLANEEGQMDQETEILEAMKEGLKPKRASKALTAQFFRTNERKLNALIDATTHDMEAAETAILRKANDVYRKTIFNAQVYANTGAGTYEKAVDMATKDLMAAGLTCVEYKNGARHTLPDYADMALRTANKRAYLQGEGAKRQEWGIHTVIVNKRLKACPHCMPFAGKVFIDDVWGGGTKEDGNYPLLSTAIEAGLYHPRCRDSHTGYFPGITDRPGKYTKAEVKAAERAEEKEEEENYARRQAERYQRLADTRLDRESEQKYKERAEEWRSKRFRVRTYGLAPEYERNTEIDACETTEAIEKIFPEISFMGGFRKMSITIQKEIAQGFYYMRGIFGAKAMPVSCNASRLDDYGKTNLRLRKIIIKQNIGIEDAFSTACHEAVHVYDYNRGLISDSIISNAFKKLGIRQDSKKADKLILDLLGWKLYNRYRNDNSELLAYAFEESLFGSENKLVVAIMEDISGSTV